VTDFLILGTDTDVGKTTFALLWLAAFADGYEFWKPLETGDSDTERVRKLVPGASVHPPWARFRQAVAPLLAARQEGQTIPSAVVLSAAKPVPQHRNRWVLIETFGSPFSPLNDSELQTALVQALGLPTVLISPSAIGTIGRTLQGLHALKHYAPRPAAVILMGPSDAFAVEQIQRQEPASPVFSLRPPHSWDVAGVARAAQEQIGVLETIRSRLGVPRQAHGAGRECWNPLSALPSNLEERDRRVIWHPYTSLQDPDPPLVCVAAQDEFLWLADGRKVIDAISSWWTILHGHRHPVLMAALRDAMASFDHVHFAGVTHPSAVELAELLLSTAPWRGGRVFFSDNGSTAVEVALKMAYQYWCHQGEPQRTCFVGFEGAYHGDTFGAMAVGRDPVFFRRFEPLLFRAEIVPLAAECLDAVLARREGEVAAVILEPLVQGAGGMRLHSAAELRGIVEVTQKHQVLFIADEVMTGGGRTGPLWAHQAAGIAPDLICAAKTLAGGVLPLAATLAAPSIVAAWQTADRSRTFFHGHSFTAHPLACAVAVANWKMLTAGPNPMPKRMEAFWNEALDPLRRHPRIRAVRVCGTIAAVELTVPGGYLADVGPRMRKRALEGGVLLRPLGSVLYAMPPFCTADASLRQIASAMIEAVESLG
jgi:adenosylmethionine-8-amino-7-oxononanoate aminotransferase